jgi:hypothetical protein
VAEPLDLKAIEDEFLNQCGPCDFAMPGACNCSTRDFRSTMLDLVREVEKLRRRLDAAALAARQAVAAEIERMPYCLGDEGWRRLANDAEEAGYDPKYVLNRRRRDDFTTAVIESAYQYGYRQAAKVARGAVSG